MIELSPFPTGYVTVELYYSGGWHDITADLSDDGVKITRRAGQPSSCELTLKSDAGKYSPRNPASPLFGLIGRNTPIRVRTQPVSGGTVHTRFVGEVASWPARWTNRGTSFAPIECAGVLRRLGQGAAPLSSPIRRGVLGLATPAHAYWPCEDGENAVSLAAASPDTKPMTITGTPSLAAYSGFVASEPIPEVGTSKWVGTVPSHTVTGTVVVRFLVYIPASGMADNDVMARVNCTGGTIRRVDLLWTAPGSVQLMAYDAEGGVIHNGTEFYVTAIDKTWRMSVELVQDGGDVDIAVRMIAPGSPAGYLIETIAGQTTGRCNLVTINPDQTCASNMAVGHVTVESAYAALYDLQDELQGWDGEDAGDRFERLCAEEGVTAAAVAEPAQEMGVQGTKTLLELLDDAADTAAGLLFDTRSAVGLTLRPAESLYAQAPALEVAYTDNLLRPFEPTEDDQGTRNRVTVTRGGGTSATVQRDDGALAVAEIGLYDEAVTLSLADDDQPAEHAAWRVALGTHDEPRWPTIGVDLADSYWLADSALTEAVLAVDIGDRIDVSNLPAWLPPDDVRGLVTGYDEEIGPMHYRVTFTCLPERPYEVGVWDGTGSRYSGAGTVLAEALDATETGVDVTPPAGVTWTHADGDYDVVVGGERMTVTAVAGNTLTVTRSVNGVAKTHASGAALDLAEPVRYAL